MSLVLFTFWVFQKVSPNNVCMCVCVAYGVCVCVMCVCMVYGVCVVCVVYGVWNVCDVCMVRVYVCGMYDGRGKFSPFSLSLSPPLPTIPQG